MSDFRKFTDQMEYSGEPSAKLYMSGKIRFNKIAGRLWFDGVEYVEIFVSDENDEICFKPATRSKEGTYSYSRDGEHGGHISIRSVLPYYGIWHERVDESVALPVKANDNGVIVDISEPVERWGRPSVGGG